MSTNHASETVPPLSRPKSLTDQATDAIRAMILTGELQLGEALSEITLAARLGVSKTPVREALLQLKLEGLVDVQPQRGTFVFRISAAQVRKLTEIREVFEISALELAMQRNRAELVEAVAGLVKRMREAVDADNIELYRTLDYAFHQAFIDAAQNPYLSEAWSGIAFRVQALRNRLSSDLALNRTSLEEHEKILGEIRKARPDAKIVATLLRAHIRGTEEHYLASL